MASPKFINLEKNVWKRVAKNIAKGKVHIIKGPGSYFHTYTETGKPAPTNKELGVTFKGITEKIDSNIGVDYYVLYDHDSGKVRVDTGDKELISENYFLEIAESMLQLLGEAVVELKKTNLHLTILSDNDIKNTEIER